jgi:hypothetical protein
MIVLNLIPKFVNDMFDKCGICMQTKITRKSFPKIDRSSILLQLVHSDVCDMYSNPTVMLILCFQKMKFWKILKFTKQK